jgi:heme/copper-type cytochrome/quinol oxidase subunit 3
VSERLAPERPGLPALLVAAPEWDPAIDARVARVGMRILLGAEVTFFAAFFFAFFYLRALNNNDSWQPPGVTHPTQGIGALIVLLLIACAVLYWFGARVVATSPASARLMFWLAMLAGVLCIATQVYEFRNLGFDPQLGGGYPSVFVAMKGALMVQLAGALFWLATHIAQAAPAGDSVARPESTRRFSWFLIFLGGMSLVAFVILYFV